MLVGGVDNYAIAADKHFCISRRQLFYIVNEANGSVMEIRRGAPKPGAEVGVDKKRPEKAAHQLWYLDDEGLIHSKLNTFVPVCKGRLKRRFAGVETSAQTTQNYASTRMKSRV